MKSLAATLMFCLLARAAQAAAPSEGARGAIERAGCGACHVIPGIAGASGLAGPPLNGVGRRVYLAGVLPNTPANMALWISRPQSVRKGDAMPDQKRMTPDQAAVIAAYLETLR